MIDMKQFNLEKKIFDDIEHGLNGDGWYLIDNQTDVDGISASITGDGDVWSENGNLHYSGRRPSDNHKWDNENKEWVKMTKAETQEKLTALLADTQTRFIANIDEHAAKIYSTWTRFESEYRERQTAAEAFKSANYEGECSRYISDFAQRAKLDNKTATNLILTQAAGLEKLQMELANQRMRKYELKAPNLTLEQLQSIHDDIIKQMDNLMEAYQNG